MLSIEQKIKNQYAKVFKSNDWNGFKLVADFYLKRAAILKKSDVDIDETFQLLMRNVQKRLFLGIACELLLKSSYLKCKFVINKPIDRNRGVLIPFVNIRVPELNKYDTFTLSQLIDQFKNVLTFSDWATIEKGLKILKVFRNKEGHVAAMWHTFNDSNYRDIEKAVILIYREVFDEDLTFTIAMVAGDKGQFKIRS